MNKHNIRSRFTPSENRKTLNEAPSKTKQAPEASSNINNIMRNYQRQPLGSSLGNPNATRQPVWGNLTSMSLHDMLNIVTDVQNKFRMLPARVKSRFGTPYQLIRWIEQPENSKEAVRLGLIHNPELLEELKLAEAAADAEAKKTGEKPDPAPQPDDEANPRKTSKKA